MTVNGARGRKGKDMAGAGGWREEATAAGGGDANHRRQRGRNPAGPRGSGLCSSQGLPMQRAEAGLQDVNKAKGTTGTLKQNGSARGDKFSSILFDFIVLSFFLECEQQGPRKKKKKKKNGHFHIPRGMT